MRICVFIAAILVAAILSPHRADAQVPPASDDPLLQLQHGHALLIGNSHYRDPHWPQLDDVPLQLDALRRGLLGHFDTVDVAPDLETEKLRQTITDFLQTMVMTTTRGYSFITPATAIPRSFANVTKIADTLLA